MPPRRSYWIGFYCAAAVLTASLCWAQPEPLAVLTASPFGGGTEWDGPQFVGADAKGRVFVLRAQELEVYPVGKGGGLGEPKRLQTAPLTEPVVIMDAAMDRHGDWVMKDKNELRWFRSGKEVPLPELHWGVTTVALRKGTPIVAVLPFPSGHVQKSDYLDPPLLLSPGEHDWSVLAPSVYDTAPDFHDYTRVMQEQDGRLLVDAGADVWLACRYRYRLVRYSGTGQERMTLEVGGAKLQQRSDAAVAASLADLETELARMPERPEATTTITVNQSRELILDLTEGRDGNLYLLLAGDESGTLLLDRFDRARRVLERVPVRADARGILSIAAGKDALYLVPFSGHATRWRIPWADVERADWQPVEDVVLDGLEMDLP